jgi:hypothetical protein
LSVLIQNYYFFVCFCHAHKIFYNINSIQSTLCSTFIIVQLIWSYKKLIFTIPYKTDGRYEKIDFWLKIALACISQWRKWSSSKYSSFPIRVRKGGRIFGIIFLSLLLTNCITHNFVADCTSNEKKVSGLLLNNNFNCRLSMSI